MLQEASAESSEACPDFDASELYRLQKAFREAALIELDPKYVDVIVERWQTQTRQTANLEASEVSARWRPHDMATEINL